MPLSTNHPYHQPLPARTPAPAPAMTYASTKGGVARGPARWINLLGRVLLPLLVIITLFSALWAGLYRLGWTQLPVTPALPMAHGPLMVGGFLGALVSLERAVAVRYPWALLAPVLAVLGAILGALGVAAPLPALLITVASLILLIVLIQLWRMVPALFAVTIALGGLCWWAGNVLWLLGNALPTVVYWWMAFLVLTIAGERLELSRMLRLSRFARGAFAAAVVTILTGLLLTLAAFDAGVRLVGLGLLLVTLWLAHYDMARRRVRAGGQARYMALALISGYGWLGVGGLLALLFGGVMAGPHYDALLHAVFVGFVLAMIFAHALIILPVLTQRVITYTPAFYLPLGLLHVTLILRVAGDLIPYWPARLWGGMLNALVLLLFMGILVSRLVVKDEGGRIKE